MSSSSSENSLRNWLELPREVTASIMSRLVAVEILTNVQFACKSWFEISKDPFIWRRIDMHKIGDLDLDMDLVGMCRHAVDRSSGMLADINIENFGNDDLLEYIAERAKGLKRLGLACCYRVSEERMIDVISKLPFLEEIDLTFCMFSVEILEAVGRSCPRLSSLKLNSNAYSIPNDFDPDEEVVHNAEAVSIGKNMPGLRRLQVFGNSMTNMGLKAILDGCPHLESLDLRRCLNLNMDETLLKRCKDRVKELRLPFDPTDDYDFAAGHGDGSDVGLFDDCHHWFSGGEEDYLELMDDDEDDDDFDYSDVSDEGEPFDYDDLV